MTVYRLYLGADNVSEDDLTAFLAAHVSHTFPGFTVYRGTGYWYGLPEKSITLEIIADTKDIGALQSIARAWTLTAREQAVLISLHEVKAELVSNPASERVAA